VIVLKKVLMLDLIGQNKTIAYMAEHLDISLATAGRWVVWFHRNRYISRNPYKRNARYLTKKAVKELDVLRYR